MGKKIKVKIEKIIGANNFEIKNMEKIKGIPKKIIESLNNKVKIILYEEDLCNLKINNTEIIKYKCSFFLPKNSYGIISTSVESFLSSKKIYYERNIRTHKSYLFKYSKHKSFLFEKFNLYCHDDKYGNFLISGTIENNFTKKINCFLKEIKNYIVNDVDQKMK